MSSKSIAELLAEKKARRVTQKASPLRAVSPTSSSSNTRKQNLASKLARLENRLAKLAISNSSSVITNKSNKVERAINTALDKYEEAVKDLAEIEDKIMTLKEDIKESRSLEKKQANVLKEESLAAPMVKRGDKMIRSTLKKKINDEIDRLEKYHKAQDKDLERLYKKRDSAIEKIDKLRLKTHELELKRNAPIEEIVAANVVKATRRRKTENELKANANALRNKLQKKQERNQKQSTRKLSSDRKKLESAKKKLEGFNDDVLEAFCEDLRMKKVASRAASPLVAAKAASRPSSPFNNQSLL